MTRTPRTPSTPDLVTEAVRLYQVEGLSIRQVAARLGRSYGGVHRDLTERAGIQLRPHGGSRRRDTTTPAS